MTLRLRLVLAVGALVVVGLAVFGVVTVTLYSRNAYARLDEQLRNARPVAEVQLLPVQGAGPNGTTGPNPTPGADPLNGRGPAPGSSARPLPPFEGGIDVYAELREPDGRVVATKALQTSTARPDLPAALAPTPGGRFVTVGSSDGSGDWRAFVTPVERAPGRVIVLAAPLSGVGAVVQQLVVTEALTGTVLLVVLAGGAWLILRAGLRPLEHMADSARAIKAGDLSQRVTPADEGSEVGELGLALNTMLDEIEAAFREREATEERLRQFLADASHELRTPLTSIQGFAELFRLGAGQERAEVDRQVMMRRIEEESARMRVLVDDLLLLARLDRTRDLRDDDVDLAVLAADACTDAAAAATGRAVSLEAPVPVVVRGDPDHLRQAVGNLVANALRHTPEGTAIEVRALRQDGRALLVVRDHGDGLADDALDHAFDRFWQADAARVGTGAGLGLSIVAAIAAEHGGTARARNHPDGGAEFTIDLPVAREDPGRPSSPSEF